MPTDAPRNEGPELRGRYCSVRQAADYAGVSLWTVRKWIRARLLRVSRPLKGRSTFRIDVASLKKALGETTP